MRRLTHFKKRLALLLALYLAVVAWWPPIQIFLWTRRQGDALLLEWWQRALLYFLELGAISLAFGSLWLLCKIPNEEFEV